MAKIHCHSLLSGSSWSSYEDKSPLEEPEAMEVDENNGLDSPETTRLQREDMTLFGLCPEQEEIILVICKECGRVVKTAALLRHCEVYHHKALPVPAPSSPEEMSTTTSSTVVETLLQTGLRKGRLHDSIIKNEKIELMDATVKIEEMPLTVPCLNHILSSPVIKQEGVNNITLKKSASEKIAGNKKSPRKQVPTREREFDADKHCGVWMADHQKRCTRSLTCKTHALSLRRAVPGRRKPFDELLAEHKARVNCEKEQQQNNALKLQEQAATQKASDLTLKRSTSTSDSSITSGGSSRSLVGRSISLEDENHRVAKGSGEGDSDSIDDGTSSSGVTLLDRHPKPLASCHFGSRSVGRGCFVFNRRSDHFRCAVLSMVERCINPSLTRQKSNRPSAAILQRPTMKTVGQSTNQGSSLVTEKYKSQTNKTLNNFLKAPPPPRNKSFKQASSGHGMNHVDSSLNNSRNSVFQGSSQNKRTYLDSIGSHLSTANSNGLPPSSYLKPDASSQAISDMGNIVANIETNVSGGHPLTLGHPLSVVVSKTSVGPGPSLNINATNASLDSSLNLCSSLGINAGNAQGPISTTQTTFVTTSVAPMMSTASGTQMSGVTTTVPGQIQPVLTNVKEILPAPMAGRVTVGSVASSVTSPVYKGVQLTAQVDPSTGKVTTTSAGQRVSPVFLKQNATTVQVTSMPNGTGPSPPPAGGNVKGYPLNFVIQGNSTTQGANTSVAGVTAPVGTPVNLTKGQSLIFNNMGISQLQPQSQVIVQQPPSPMNQNVHQRGKGGIVRSNSIHKGIQKAPSPSSQAKVAQVLTSQQSIAGQQGQTTVVINSPQGNQKLYLNHQHLSSSQQPIAQLKQQVAQVQQQQLQQITLQQQLQQQQLQQQQQQHLQQQKQHISSQFMKQQLPIQPRIAPAPPSQSFNLQQPLTGQNVIVKVTEQLKSPPNAVFVATEPRQNIQHAVCQKPQSNVV